MNAITSKEFSSRKSAQAAARREYGADYADKVSIDTLDEKWYVSEIAADVTGDPLDPLLGDTPNYAEIAAEFNAEPQAAEGNATDEPESAITPGLLAGLCGQLSGTVTITPPAQPAPKAEPKTTGLIIEKNRPEKNGVKRPSAGGLCRAVWDACWAQKSETGEVPTAKWVKEKAAAMGWNPNNASIEYYQWRKFNGISGRVAAPAQAEVETKVEGE